MCKLQVTLSTSRGSELAVAGELILMGAAVKISWRCAMLTLITLRRRSGSILTLQFIRTIVGCSTMSLTLTR